MHINLIALLIAVGIILAVAWFFAAGLPLIARLSGRRTGLDRRHDEWHEYMESKESPSTDDEAA